MTCSIACGVAARSSRAICIAGIAAALEALGCDDGEAEAATCVAVDDDGDTIRLMMHREGTASAARVLSPVASIRLAGELLDAAGIRLADDLARTEATGQMISRPPQRRQLPTRRQSETRDVSAAPIGDAGPVRAPSMSAGMREMLLANAIF